MRFRIRKKLLFVLAVVFFMVALGVQGQTGVSVVNGDFAIREPQNSNLAYGWQASGNSYTIEVVRGNPMLKIGRGGGAIQKVVLNQTEAKPVRISVSIRGEGIIDDPKDKLGASLDCKVTYRVQGGVNPAGFCFVTPITKSVGSFETKRVGYNTMEISSQRLPVDSIEVRLKMGDVDGIAWFDDVRVEEFTPMTEKGLISLVFDDSLVSTYNYYPTLRANGLVGTAAVVTSYIGVGKNHMTLEQLKELQAHGWGIESHTVTHSDLTKLSSREINNELFWSYKFLTDNGFPVKHLMVPFGAYNGRIMGEAQDTRSAFLYKSVRTTEKGINPQGVFPFNIHVRELQVSTSLAEAKAWLEETREERGWLVILIHEIDNPNGVYTVTSDRLGAILCEIIRLKIPVVTYDHGFEEMMKRQMF
jgi:peptidoglycan/xylan/chitin deacetylase (PgdA/CDA1 family)